MNLNLSIAVRLDEIPLLGERHDRCRVRWRAAIGFHQRFLHSIGGKGPERLKDLKADAFKLTLLVSDAICDIGSLAAPTQVNSFPPDSYHIMLARARMVQDVCSDVAAIVPAANVNDESKRHYYRATFLSAVLI